MTSRWDIFCRIVDNYGDIGVCWRLARQLAHEYDLSVRLWVDDLPVAARLIEGLDTTREKQRIAGVEIHRWTEPLPETGPADVVIEAFACELPPAYLQAMAVTRPVWLNLEYLSAEDWVDGFHAQLSIQPQSGLKKYFFFPGFTAVTGGLLREQGLLEQRDTFLADAEAGRQFWQTLDIDNAEAQLKISLFCYPHAPITQLLDSLAQSSRPILCIVPEGIISGTVRAHFNTQRGNAFLQGNLTVKPIPFLQQPEYDRLLWACDLNIVRGEDSWIRAIWAGKPFIWQPYPQNDNVHLQKLEAFLQKYAPAPESQIDHLIRESHHGWLTRKFCPRLWQQILARLPDWNAHASLFSYRMADRQDLAAKLVNFCQNKV